MAKQFTKIAYNPKTGRVVLRHQEANGTEEPDSYTLDAKAEPRAEFLEALSALAPDVVDLCELDGVDESDIEVRGVSLFYKDGIMGATITGLRSLRRSTWPLVLNTPFKPVEHYSGEGDEEQLLPEDTAERVLGLVWEAGKYLAGERAIKTQTDAFDDEDGGERSEVPVVVGDGALSYGPPALVEA